MKMKYLLMYFFLSIITIDNLNALNSHSHSLHHSRNRKMRMKNHSKKSHIKNLTTQQKKDSKYLKNF